MSTPLSSPSHSFARPLALVAAVAVVLALVYWFVQGERPAPIAKVGEAAASESANAAPSAAPVELAATDSAPASNEPVPAQATTEKPADARAVVGAALDGRTWKQVLVAVDRTTNEPIANARLDLVDAEGELRRVTFDEAVLATDLAEGVLLALDAPTHVPRFFFAKHLAGHVGAPRPVQLHPSGSLRISLADPDSNPPPIDVNLWLAQSWELAARLDAHLVEQQVDSNEEFEPFFALAKSLRHLVSDANDPRSRKRQLKWLARTEKLHVALTPDGPPTVAGWLQLDRRGVTSWPLVIDDLPANAEVTVSARSTDSSAKDALVELRRAGESEWSSIQYQHFPIPISAAAITDIELRVAGAATVRGLLPVGATDGHVRVLREAGENMYRYDRDEPVPQDGGFTLHGLAPGRVALTLMWRDQGGAFAVRAFDLTLAPGEDRDLGRIAVAEDARSLTIASALFLDGVPDTSGLGGRLPTFEFEVTVQHFRPEAGSSALASPPQQLRITGPGDVVIRGLVPGRYFVHPAALQLPTELSQSHLVTTVASQHDFDLASADGRCTVEHHLASSLHAQFRFNLPPAAKGSHVWLDVVAFSIDDGTEVACDVKEPSALFGRQQVRTYEASAALPPGEWLLVAVARPTWIHNNDTSLTPYDGETLRSFVGTKRFSTDDLAAPLVVDLELAAVVKCLSKTLDGSTPQTYVAARPADFPVTSSRMWVGYDLMDRDTFEIWCLLPNTDYVDGIGEPLFRTGAGGSVTELDLR